MIYCVKCGREVEDDFLFCPYCGLSIEKENLSEEKDETEESFVQPENFCAVDDLCSQEEITIEEQSVEEEKEQEAEKSYIGTMLFVIISVIANAFLKPITLIWCVPMSIYILMRIGSNMKIGGWSKFFSWLLISPIVGMLLINYQGKEQQ